MTLPTYTAKQFASALGLTPPAVWQRLPIAEPTGKTIVAGKETATFTVSQLPAQWRERLADTANRQHYRTVEALLDSPRQRWQPPVPMAELCEANIREATKLREAMARSLYHQHDMRLTAEEFEASGVEDYRRVFGHTVSTRHWRELFNRTVQRDNGFEEYGRLEIYLSDRLKKKEQPADVVSEALAEEFAELEDFTSACGNPPSKIEQRGVWTLALEKFRSLVHAGTPEKSAARRVRDFLFARAKFLIPKSKGDGRNALRMAWERRLEAWQNVDGDAKAIRDGRTGEHLRYSLPENDRDLLIHRAVFTYRDDIAPAWRDLLRKGFSTEVVERYAGRAQKKSHVPTSVMDSIAPEVEVLTVMHRGPRAFDSIKGHVTRSYEGISSLQCVSGDDFTMNTYFYIPDGKGWFELTRGQVILFIDFRSLRILGWALEPRKSYSSLTIRSLCTHVFGEFGAPAVLYFERGIWKNANLLKGKTDPFTFAEISTGLHEFGITFKHAIRPRTKAVERIGGMFQDIAEAEPGYCGRDERRDAPESLRKQMAEVAARKVHPTKYFYSYEQWNQRIGQLAEQYNAEPQQGHILAGLSPDQGFEKFIDLENPPLQFSAGLRYLLAHDKRLARVSLNGITIQVGKQKFNYRGQEIAHLVGREVLAWFDPENPETIVLTNPDRTNPICVARSENPNALESLIEPAAGTLGRELSRIEGQASHLKTRFNVLKAKFPLPQRQMLAAVQTVELGEQIGRQKTEIAETQKRHRREQRTAEKIAERSGLYFPASGVGKLTPEQLRTLGNLEEEST